MHNTALGASCQSDGLRVAVSSGPDLAAVFGGGDPIPWQCLWTKKLSPFFFSSLGDSAQPLPSLGLLSQTLVPTVEFKWSIRRSDE